MRGRPLGEEAAASDWFSKPTTVKMMPQRRTLGLNVLADLKDMQPDISWSKKHRFVE